MRRLVAAIALLLTFSILRFGVGGLLTILVIAVFLSVLFVTPKLLRSVA